MQVFATPVRWVHLFGGQLYATGANAPIANVLGVGTGLPRSGPQIAVSLPGMATMGTATSPFSFVFFDSDAGVPGVDLVYVADDGDAANRGVQKWTLSPGQATWVKVATFNLPTGASITLVASTSEAAQNRLVVFVDDGVTPAAVIATAPANTLFKGAALSPHL